MTPLKIVSSVSLLAGAALLPLSLWPASQSEPPSKGGGPPEASDGAGQAEQQRFTDPLGSTSTWWLWRNKGTDSRPAPGLLIWLHPDGGANGLPDTVRGWGQDLLRDENLVLLAPVAPSGRTWHDDGLRHAAWLDQLLQSDDVRGIRTDPARTWFAGTSGGAVFLAGHFMALYGHKYQGGALLLCGGAPSLVLAADDQVFITGDQGPARYAADFPVYARVSRFDYIHKQTLEGVKFLRDMGLRVHLDVSSEPGHCGFSLPEAVRKGLRAAPSAP